MICLLELNSNAQDKYLDWQLNTKLRPIDPNHYLVYHMIFSQYVEEGLFSLKKNDKRLFNYLQENQIYINDIDKVIEKLLIEHFNLESIADNILVILDYLKWSYGIEVDYKSINVLKYKKEPIKHENYVVPIPLREQLLRKYGKCKICGITKEELLITSHLKPQKDSTEEEKFDINNVLLLCNKHDGLIDKGLITFDDEGNIIISKGLSEEDVKLLGLEKEIKIELNEKQLRYIQYHRENVFEKKKDDFDKFKIRT